MPNKKYLNIFLLLNLSRGYFSIKNSFFIKRQMSILPQCMPQSLCTTQGRGDTDAIKDFDTRFDAFLQIRNWSKVAGFWKRLIGRLCDNDLSATSDLIIPNFLNIKGLNRDGSCAPKVIISILSSQGILASLTWVSFMMQA